MHDKSVHRARIVSSVAATIISLACGTNVGPRILPPTRPSPSLTAHFQYVYSGWAPQFADKLRLSATESNLIGLAGNLGMYSCGIPIGMVIDTRGPRPAVVLGSVLLGCGYFFIKTAFDAGSGSVPLICLFSFLTGLGGCMAFAAAVKTSALNWPHHRGTATAFPLAAFGLSAFVFSIFGILFPGDTSDFIMALAVGTFVLTLGGFFFLRVLPHHSYHAVPGGDHANAKDSTDSQQLRPPLHGESRGGRPGRGHFSGEPGTSNQTTPNSSEVADGLEAPQPPQGTTDQADVEAGPATEEADMEETSSLMSSSHSSLPGDVLVQSSVDLDRSHRVDIRGWRLLRNVEFWQFFSIMGILAGIGLMTIKYDRTSHRCCRRLTLFLQQYWP